MMENMQLQHVMWSKQLINQNNEMMRLVPLVYCLYNKTLSDFKLFLTVIFQKYFFTVISPFEDPSTHFQSPCASHSNFLSLAHGNQGFLDLSPLMCLL